MRSNVCPARTPAFGSGISMCGSGWARPTGAPAPVGRCAVGAARAHRALERVWLFHGTDEATVPKITQQGFNRSFCGKNATAFGKGVYFARDSAYSTQRQYMYLIRFRQ